MEELNKKFSFSEQIAILLYKSSNKQVHYETYVLTQILIDLDYIFDYHQKTFEYLVKRHENMRAYFKLNEDDSIERVYNENYIPKVLPLVSINENASPDNLEKLFFEHYDNNYSIEKLPGIKVLLIKASNGLFSLIRGHHCYLEVETAKILHKEALFIYKKVYDSNGHISYDDAVCSLPILPKFTEYINELHENIKSRMPLINDYLSDSLISYKHADKANSPVIGNEYFYEKFRIDTKNSKTEKFLIENKIKPHQVIKTIHQIAISKILDTNIPLIFNVNSQRSHKWTNHYTCQAKNHPFYVEVNLENTFEEQLKYNEVRNKKMLEIFGPLDAYMCKGEGDTIFPVSQHVFNFCYNNEENILFRPDLRKETKIETDYPMNMYCEVYYRTNEYFLVFYLSKLAAVSEDKTLKIKKFLIDTYNNLPLIWNCKIKHIN